MPEIIQTKVYRLDELTAAAKQQARAWFREGSLDDFWFEFIYDDFERICGMLGVELDTRPVRVYGGGQRRKPCIWFSGFWSQGDGACFEGRYRYAGNAVRRIREYAPVDSELHQIADTLQAIQRRNFYRLSATIAHRGRYFHEQTMAIAVSRDSANGQDMTRDAEDTVTETLRDLARWLYRQLEREFDYQTSDAAVDEAIAINQYTFTEAGRRFG
ncbi:antitoxin of toxin-antitoxin stability system [Acidiphilium sp.]|uniref:antitoxin of toxin-antitoxin stability system n=1 Tax=Acidiphilium sp. TaxID=527 RepID=UPI0025856118|nr:antitoxin of toxin-antitoxin stability system [Acidiphilium sp.]